MISILCYHLRVALSILTRICHIEQNRGTDGCTPTLLNLLNSQLVATVDGDEQPQNKDEQVDVGQIHRQCGG
jgi:hypothetical protein